MNRDYAWDEFRGAISGVQGSNPWDKSLIVHAGPPIPIAGARGLSQGGVSGDIAAFPVLATSKTHVLRLAVAKPRVGDKV